MKSVSIIWNGCVTEYRGEMSECAANCLAHQIQNDWELKQRQIRRDTPLLRRIIRKIRRRHAPIPPAVIIKD